MEAGPLMLRLPQGGLGNLAAYLAAHVLLCLAPAFFIAGSLTALAPWDSITRFLGRKAPRHVSYPASAMAGSVLSVAAPAETGIRHEGRSKSVDEDQQAEFDLVVTVCDSAAEDRPIWLGRGTRRHIGFPDPTRATSSEAEVMDAFRQVRDSIRRPVLAALHATGPSV